MLSSSDPLLTGTLISFLPPSRSGSVTVTVIGPSASVPGLTFTSPVSGSIVAGTSLPFLSFAVTSVSSSLFSTLIPVPCSSPFGFTGVSFSGAVTFVFLSPGCSSFTVTFATTSSVDLSG